MSEKQKEFFSKVDNIERLKNCLTDKPLLQHFEKINMELFPKYQKAVKNYDKQSSIYGCKNHTSKDLMKIDKIDKSISYFKEQIELEKNRIKGAEQRIALLQQSIEEKERDNSSIMQTPSEEHIAVSKARYDLEAITNEYNETKFILEAYHMVKSFKHSSTTKTTKIVKETTTTTIIDKGAVSVRSKTTTTTIHTNDYITSDTEYNGDDESITSSIADRRQERNNRRYKRTLKRINRLNENEGLIKRCMKPKPLSFDPEDIESNYSK